MEYIRITKENIDKEHICCAMSGKQSLAKKEWLKQRFEEGLVFYRSAERGKCFIEYIPAENAWVPIEAAGWLYINCLWVSGSLKGHGYSSELLEECLRDAKAQGKNGVCILCAEGRKREFLADPKFLNHKGFKVSDISDCGINLMCLPLAENAQPPKFKACAKHPKVEEKGFVLYYTDQCPYTYYWSTKCTCPLPLRLSGAQALSTAAAMFPRQGLPAFRPSARLRWGSPSGAGAGCPAQGCGLGVVPHDARFGQGCSGCAFRCRRRTAADSSAAQRDSPQWRQRRR